MLFDFSIRLVCNYIAIKCKNAGVYQYAVSFSPEVDSLRMRYKLLEEQKTRDIIGDVRGFDGRILFLPIHLPNLVFLFVLFIIQYSFQCVLFSVFSVLLCCNYITANCKISGMLVMHFNEILPVMFSSYMHCLGYIVWEFVLLGLFRLLAVLLAL